MDWIQVTVLALIQGLTEFLPISSSGHLILPSQLFGWPDQGLAFDVGVHVGTLTAVILFFRKDVIAMIIAWFGTLKGVRTPEGLLAWYVAFATIPAVAFGLAINDIIDIYGRHILVIAGTTLIFGGVLWWADKNRTEARPIEHMTIRDAVLIGLAQAVALIPGTSRSGITISAALMLGLERQAAARFSFLLSIPIILGAGLLKGKELAETGTDAQWSMVIGGAIIAALSAFACIHFFLKWLDRIGMMPFVIYRMLLGITLIGVYFATY